MPTEYRLYIIGIITIILYIDICSKYNIMARYIFMVCTSFTVINLSSHLRISTQLENIYNNKYNTGGIIDNSYEYPGSNINFRHVQKNRWIQYYMCLIEKKAQIRSQEILHPIALIVLEGTSVTLKCEICVSPLEVYRINAIEWYFNSSSNDNITNELIQSTHHILVTQNNKYLQMYNIQLQQGGQYWCKMKDTIGAPYYLHIDNGSEGIDIVHPETVLNTQHPSSSQIITEYNIRVHTTWSNWSPCSKCNDIGINIRYGYCTLSWLENPTYYASKDANELNQVKKNTHQNIEAKKNLKFIMETLLFVFKNKLPCKSRHVPNHIQEHLIIKQRKIEMMIGYCKKKCLNDIMFKIYNNDGNTIESTNNSAGIYSMLQEIPSSLPAVTRTVLYTRNNKKIEIKCPGNLNIEVPITWKIGTETLFRPFNKHQLNARIYINPRMHIVIRKLDFTDNNVYSCWQNNQLAGTVKLIVTGELQLKLNYQIMMFGTIVIISVFTLVSWRAFKGKMRFTKH